MQTPAQEMAAANPADTATEEKSSQLKAFLLNLASGLIFRLAVTFVVSAAAVALIADVAYPTFTTDCYNRLAAILAEDAKNQIPDSPKVLRILQQHNLAWYYITDSGGKVSPTTLPFYPDLPAPVKNFSHNEKWHGKRYFEAVAAIDAGDMLHVGFYVSPIVFSQLGSPVAMIEPCPLGPLLAIFAGVLAASLSVSYLSVVKPAAEIEKASRAEALAGGEPEPLADLSAAVAELKCLADIIESLQARLRALKAAPASPAAEGRKAAGADKTSLEVSNTQNRISEFYTKDAEEEFINILTRELDALKSSHQLFQRVLDKLNDKFPTSIVYGAMFKANRDQRFVPEAFLGFDDRTVQIIKRIDHQRIASEAFSTGAYLSLNADSMREYGLQTMLASISIKTAIYLPLSFQGRNLGMLAVYFRTEGKTVQDRMHFLHNAVGAVSRCLYEVLIYEEELQAALTDPLTGVRNRKFLQELLPKVFARAVRNPNENPVTLVIMHADHYNDVVDTCGQAVSDQLVKALAQTIGQSVRTTDGDGKGAPGDYLIRYGNEEFFLLMENTDAARALAVAERIRGGVAHKSDWPGGITRWSLSAGVASYPQDAKNAEDLLLKADMAVHYVQDELGANKVCHVGQVPDDYKVSKETAAIGGELGVFDAAALLQSLSTAQKSGILTVAGPDEKHLWMLFEGGKPVQAKLGKFGGALAIVEFIITFQEGNFSFQEKVLGPKDTTTKLPRLDAGYNVTKGLERCLMDGALAQDKFDAARAILNSTETVIRPIGAVEFSARWQALSQLPDKPSSEDFNIMSDIVQRADGKTTLTAIFKSMDTVPTAQLWRAAALLIQHGLVSKSQALAI